MIWCVILQETRISEPAAVLELPESSCKKCVPHRLCATVTFPSEDLAVISDGAETLYVVKTGPRAESHSWTVSAITRYFILVMHPVVKKVHVYSGQWAILYLKTSISIENHLDYEGFGLHDWGILPRYCSPK